MSNGFKDFISLLAAAGLLKFFNLCKYRFIFQLRLLSSEGTYFTNTIQGQSHDKKSSLGLETGVWLLAAEEHVDDNMHSNVTWGKIFHYNKKLAPFQKRGEGWKGKDKN